MVAHLLRLRLLILRNSLRGKPLQIVGVVIGGLYGLAVVGLIWAGMIGLSLVSVEAVRIAAVLGGAVLILGWTLGPILVAGVDQSLEPAKLLTFPIERRTLITALALAGVIGIPGALTLLGALGTLAAWWAHPVSLIAAIVCAVVGLATCIVASRLVTTASAGFSTKRRYKELSGVVIFIPLVLLGPIIIWLTNSLRGAADALPRLADIVAWTPLGAVWAVPGDLAAGDVAAAGIRFVIGLATLAVLVLLWWRALGAAMETPSTSGGAARGGGRLGLLGRLPGTPAGAVMARSLVYWIRDPRYARQFIMIPVVPILLFFYAFNPFGGDDPNPGLFNAAAPLLALVIAISTMIDVAYDGTAFAAHITSGIRGRDDRAGRAAAALVVTLPGVLVVAVLGAVFSGTWALQPAILGMSVAILLAGIGTSAVSSARIVYPVPGPGDNPFKSTPGAGVISSLSTFAVWGISIALAVPTGVLGIVAFVMNSPLLAWITLVVGIATGVLVLVFGVRLGGRTLDRRAPELFEQLVRNAA